MKKHLLLISTFTLIYFTSFAQFVTIPNNTVRENLKSIFPSCFNQNEQMDTTCAEILNTKQLQIHGFGNSDSTGGLYGLQYFKNLESFHLSATQGLSQINYLPSSLLSLKTTLVFNLTFPSPLPANLQELSFEYFSFQTQPPSLPTSLKYLYCREAESLTGLPELPSSLLRFECSNLQSTTNLPELPAGLKYLKLDFLPLLNQAPTFPANVDTIICSATAINNLPALPTNLKYLDCSGNTNITTLPQLPSQLIYLNCSNIGKLTALPSLPVTLKILNCNNNLISTLPPLPVGMQQLWCNKNKLSILPTLPLSLTMLRCENNSIQTMPYLPASLKIFYCSNNLLQQIPTLPDSLIDLGAYSNKLTQLPALPSTLTHLDCSSNLITSLPQMPSSLIRLLCSNNQLSELPALPDTMALLVCENNNIYCIPKIPEAYIENPFASPSLLIIFDTDKIHCIPNKPTGVEIGSGIPLCTPLTNKYHCQAFPVISGKLFYDNNSNGIKDIGELYKSNIGVQLSANNKTFTNNTGYFELVADTGSHTMTVLPPNFYTASPATFNYLFSTFDTLISQTIPLQPVAVVDSMFINVHHNSWAARPGFSFSYLVQYENIGTTTLTPGIIFNYDGNLLTYDSCSENTVVHAGNTLSLNQNNFVPGEKRSFIAYFTIKPTAPLGDTLYSSVTASAGNANTGDNDFMLIGGSFDPNDKQATPELSPQQVADGKYITYTIRCQNTGTDTAFNVVIADTLSNLLQPTTLEILNSSHSCNISIKNNIIYFEFFNILLPDSNQNETGSHGFVTFRIKPQSTVTNGTKISNKASIYFDYNQPIVTNTANTLIQNPVLSVPIYSFTGNGNWSNAANWSNNIIPPSNLNNGAQIIIDPAANGECILDIPQVISGTSKLTIAAGKKFKINGNLVMQ